MLAVAFAPGGAALAAGGRDGSVRIADVASGATLRALDGHSDAVRGLAFTRGLAPMAAGGGGVGGGASTGSTPAPGTPSSSVSHGTPFGPGGGEPGDGAGAEVFLVTASEDGTARVWALATGASRAVLRGHKGKLNGCAAAAGVAITFGADKDLRVWEIPTGVLRYTLGGHTDAVTAARISRDGGLALTVSTDKTGRLWDVSRGVQLYTLAGHSGFVSACALAPQARLAAPAAPAAAAGGKKKAAAAATPAAPASGACATGSADKSVRLHNCATGQPLAPPMEGHLGEVTFLAFSSDGKVLASASRDKTARTWNAATDSPTLGAPLRVFRGHAEPLVKVRAPAFL